MGLAFVAVSVGLSNFAGAIGIGVSGVDGRTRFRVGIAFGLFEALMPVVGLLLGQAIAGPLGGIGRYAGAVLLVGTGGYTIIQARRNRRREASGGGLDFRALVITAVALSLDNLVVGFALGVYRVNLLLAALLIGGVSVAMSLAGLELGSRLGSRVEEWSEELGGGVLILVGIALGSGLLK